MLMPDVNVLIYAHREDEAVHEPYAAWLKGLVDGPEPFGLSVLVAVGFLRIVTNARIYPDPSPLPVALAAIEQLCRDGTAEVPVYEIAQDGRCGSQVLDLGGSRLFLAEGIFAQEIVPACRDHGHLAAAYCVRQHRLVTFWRRLTRDLREHRKPPLVLVRRGLALLRDQRRVVAHAVDLGCEPVSPEEAYREVSALVSRSSADA